MSKALLEGLVVRLNAHLPGLPRHCEAWDEERLPDLVDNWLGFPICMIVAANKQSDA